MDHGAGRKVIERALNQKSASNLSWIDFLDLAQQLNCVGIEARNDLGRPFFDGTKPEEVKRHLTDRGLRLVGLSEVYGFNDWTDERARSIRELVSTAVAAGAETVSLIPRVDGPVADRATRRRDLHHTLRELVPVVDGAGVVAAIEPIGFASSTLRYKADLVEVLDDLGRPDIFALIHDTFQHVIANESSIFPDHTALVHISGISDPSLPLDASADPLRGSIDENDRCDSARQVLGLIGSGYSGPVSIETTLRTSRSRSVLESDFRRSFEYIEDYTRCRLSVGGGVNDDPQTSMLPG